MLLFCGCSFPLGLLKSVPPNLYTCGACTVVFSRPSWCVFVLLHNNEDLKHHSVSITRMRTCEHICQHLSHTATGYFSRSQPELFVLRCIQHFMVSEAFDAMRTYASGDLLHA